MVAIRSASILSTLYSRRYYYYYLHIIRITCTLYLHTLHTHHCVMWHTMAQRLGSIQKFHRIHYEIRTAQAFSFPKFRIQSSKILRSCSTQKGYIWMFKVNFSRLAFGIVCVEWAQSNGDKFNNFTFYASTENGIVKIMECVLVPDLMRFTICSANSLHRNQEMRIKEPSINMISINLGTMHVNCVGVIGNCIWAFWILVTVHCTVYHLLFGVCRRARWNYPTELS